MGRDSFVVFNSIPINVEGEGKKSLLSKYHSNKTSQIGPTDEC